MKTKKFSLRIAPTALAVLLVLAGCGGGSVEIGAIEPEQFSTDDYPVLAKHAAMDNEDLQRFALYANRGTDITPETVKSLSVGASINSAASTYNLRPIFDLGRLREDSRLIVDTSRSKEQTQLQIKSSKEASTGSEQNTIDGTVSGSYGGAKFAAAYHQANAWRNSKSDGSVSVSMTSANTNNLVTILNSGFTGSENFTSYLIGVKLTDEQLRAAISVSESEADPAVCSGQPYIKSVAINRYKWLDSEPYANIQILTRMEAVFTQLKQQYELCSDSTSQKQTVLQMQAVRKKIESAIADFYAYNGDSFVSLTRSMNQAVGTGSLKFGSTDGNTEAQYGGSLSVKYQNPLGGIGGSGSLQMYKQSGLATAFQDMQVSAEAKPAGVADTKAWVSSLMAMLKDQSSSIVPPMGSLPKDPGVKLPDAVGPHKDEEDPPDVAFTSYDQWKQFQEDKKAKKDAEALERAKKKVDEQAIIINDDPVLLTSMQDYDVQSYLQLSAELDKLKQRAKPPQAPPQAGNANLVRFDNMFVSGFETLPYDAVIPQLRPDLDIPGQNKMLDSFPNLMEVMLVNEKLGKLDSYLAFLSSVSASNVTPEMSNRYHQFYQKASAKAYDLITLSLSQGLDIKPEILAGYKKTVLGTASTKTQSVLYASLQDIDYYNYVVDTLLDPQKGKAWVKAPGGYLPLRWKSDGGGGMELVSWTALSQERGGHRGKEGVVAVDFGNPNADPLALYTSAMKAPQTPWYPVYIFNQAKAPALVFVQYFGAYQAIYGARWGVRPYDGDTPVVPSLKPKWADYQVLGSKEMRQAMTDSYNSFLGNMSWDYSLYFPQSSNDPARLEKFNALLLQLPGDYQSGQTLYSTAHSAAVRDFKNLEYTTSDKSDATYSAFRASMLNRYMYETSTGVRKDTAQKTADNTTFKTSLVLLPLNASTTGESFKQAFNYAPERQPMDIVTTSSLDLVNKMAVFLQ